MSVSSQQLLFLLSQPRSGSTMLQRILGTHSAIHTMQEPTIALYPLYGLREQGHQAEYSVTAMRFFVTDFLKQLSEGEEAYVEGLRRMLLHLYGQALTGSGKPLFLDKTPRYYFIIPELNRVFPEARFIILLRKPTAVLNSILHTWVQGEWLGLAHARHDLLTAPRRLLAGQQLLGERAYTIHYEQLVNQPDEQLKALCAYLQLDYEPAMLTYGQGDLPRWPYADQRSVYRHQQPQADYTERWLAGLAQPQVWRLARDYLHLLGEDVVDSLGYHYQQLQEQVAAQRPGFFARRLTFSFDWLARAEPAERPWWERRLVWLVNKLQNS